MIRGHSTIALWDKYLFVTSAKIPIQVFSFREELLLVFSSHFTEFKFIIGLHVHVCMYDEINKFYFILFFIISQAFLFKCVFVIEREPDELRSKIK